MSKYYLIKDIDVVSDMGNVVGTCFYAKNSNIIEIDKEELEAVLKASEYDCDNDECYSGNSKIRYILGDRNE